MKISHKSVMASIILICVGIVFIIIGASLGATFFGEGKFEKESFTKEFDSNKITNLDVTFRYGKLTIIPADTLKVVAKDVIKDNVTVDFNDETLVIKTKKVNFLNLPFDIDIGFFNWNYKPELTIYLPKETYLKLCKIEIGVGALNVESINADAIIIENGVGEGKIKNTSAKNISIGNGVGDLEIIDCSVEDLKIDNGVGKLQISGEITGDCNIDNGVGEINIKTTGDVEDYSFSVDNGLGNISINDESYKSFKNSSGENHFDIDNGVGEININIGG